MKSILDKGFKYVPAVKTDIRETFRRIREEEAEARRRELEKYAAHAGLDQEVVRPLKRRQG